MTKNIFKPQNNFILLDKHDLALESCCYLKTKLIMAKRISNQQLEIEELKNSLYHVSIQYANLFDLFHYLSKITLQKNINYRFD